MSNDSNADDISRDLNRALLHVRLIARSLNKIKATRGGYTMNFKDGDVVEDGDIVRIVGGFDQDTFGPISKEFIGQIGRVYGTGEDITEYIESGSGWGTYHKVSLPEPVPNLRVEVISNCSVKGETLGMDGVILSKLSPLELLSLQANE